MHSQQQLERTGAAAAYDGAAAGRRIRHRCPFCRGMMVGRRTDPSSIACDRFECTMCLAAIDVTDGIAATDVRP